MIHRILIATAVAPLLMGATPGFAEETRNGAPPAVALLPSNLRAPFCYVAGGNRSWPITSGKLGDRAVSLTAKRGENVLGRGRSIKFSGLAIVVTPDGFLSIRSSETELRPAFELQVTLGETTQTLQVRAAPPDRPISYVADLVDDIIYTFSNASTGQFRPIDKAGFDQYFRRLQAQGITRLIVWQSPFPYMADRGSYSEEDWRRYRGQAEAIINSERLTAALNSGGKMMSWSWLRQTLALRLDPAFGDKFTGSAAQHGIKLTASFRPFEPALTKYYDVPTFDGDGNYLWGFLPLASPVVNYHPDEVCFANYRTLLDAMGHNAEATLDRIVIRNVENAAELAKRFEQGHRDFEIVTADFPPIAANAFVLQRSGKQEYTLREYADIQDLVEQRLTHVDYDAVTSEGDHELQFSGIKVSPAMRYFWLKARTEVGERTEIPAAMPARLFAQAGNRLGRLNQYWALADLTPQAKQTLIAPITAGGGFHAEFQAAQASHALLGRGPQQQPLGKHIIVIDRGQPWSVEMLDFGRPRARKLAVNQLRHLLSYPAFDEIFINTRSHIQLAASQGDGVDGIRPIAHYFALKRSFQRLGIDRAFAPLAAADDQRLQKLAATPKTVEQITTWQPGAWEGTCQSPDSPSAWRFARNKYVAAGVSELLREIEREFPNRRIRAVIPPSAAVINNVQDALEEMTKPDGTKYGREYYRSIWSSLNYIPAIGEGMTLVDLSGTSIEPVFLGVRFSPEPKPLDEFVRRCVQDLAANRGSDFRGPRSFFYEAQETFRYPDRPQISRRREEIICDLLSRTEEIKEVILYEAADWTYKLPLDDPDVCGHGFLDRCRKPAKQE